MDFGTTTMQFVLALAFVLALIGILATLAKRFGFGYATSATRGRRRLAVSEIIPLDGKRKLVLLRRDTTEHLVILGPNSELLVEGDIAAPAADFAVAAVDAAAKQSPPAQPANSADGEQSTPDQAVTPGRSLAKKRPVKKAGEPLEKIS